MTQPPLLLSALRVFEAAARTGSFRAAAEGLSLTPSAVSHAVRGLERSLGVMLFVRERRAIRLTGEGELLMHHVQRGFGELQLGVSKLSARSGHNILRLHCAPSFAAQWLLPRLRRLMTETRRLDVRIAAGVDYARFLADEFDADIVYGPPPPSFYSSAQGGVALLPLGTEVVAPIGVKIALDLAWVGPILGRCKTQHLSRRINLKSCCGGFPPLSILTAWPDKPRRSSASVRSTAALTCCAWRWRAALVACR